MSDTVDAIAVENSEPDDHEIDGAPSPVRTVSKRLAGGVVCASLVGIFVVLMRASDRLVSLVHRVLINAPSWLFVLAIIAVALTWQAPDVLRTLNARILASEVMGPVLLSVAIGLGIAPALVSWRSAGWAYSKLGGVIPWSDAKDYHIGGLRLLTRGSLDIFTMRRPLNAGFYAVRMALTGENFWASMLLQGALLGAACFLLIRVVAAHIGAAGGFGLAAALFPFLHPMADLTLSESLGLTLGCLAAAALWQGVVAERPRLFALGLLLLTTALNVRAGAYFALPLLLLWVTIDNFHARRLVWRPVAVAFAAVILGFMTNIPITAMYGTGTASMNGNFSYTLYGLAHGGTGWTSAFTEFKPSDYATDSDRTDAVFHAALSEIRAHPGNLVRGIRSAYRNYFDQGIYGYAPSPVSGGLMLAMIVGLSVALARREHRRLGTMIVAAWIGILLSVPFIFEDGGFRVMAATIPILGLLPALGVAVLARNGLKRLAGSDVPPELSATLQRSSLIIASASGLAVGVLVVGPPLAVALYDSPNIPHVSCPAGKTPVVGKIGSAVPHITIVAPGVEPKNFGEMTDGQFHRDPTYAGIEIGKAFVDIPVGSTIIGVWNQLPGGVESVLVVAPSGTVPSSSKMVSFCGTPSSDSVAAAYGLMFTDKFEEVSG